MLRSTTTEIKSIASAISVAYSSSRDGKKWWKTRHLHISRTSCRLLDQFAMAAFTDPMFATWYIHTRLDLPATPPPGMSQQPRDELARTIDDMDAHLFSLHALPIVAMDSCERVMERVFSEEPTDSRVLCLLIYLRHFLTYYYYMMLDEKAGAELVERTMQRYQHYVEQWIKSRCSTSTSSSSTLCLVEFLDNSFIIAVLFCIIVILL